ncbi:MAG: choice-of-anchor L domain-containing protein, partial [Gammaproteobacteria bacterium]|nr:choice-of-anchor L domain-containing protein [Gammaproteobacteria bacterium]
MPSSTPQQWIKAHFKPLPAIPGYLEQALNIIEKEDLDKSNLSQIIELDPGMSSQLFNLINGKRKDSNRENLESIQSALSLMGEESIKDFIKSINSLGEINNTDCKQDYLQLVVRAHHAAKHSKLWAENRHSLGVKEIGIATKLHDIAEYSLCLFDYDHYKNYKINNLTQLQSYKHSKSIWGFDLHQLALELSHKLNLPDLITEAHTTNEIAGIRTLGIKLACNLVHQADIGWYQQEMDDCLIKAADHCQISYDKMCTLAHITSIDAAHENELAVNFHSASRLVQYHSDSVIKAEEEISESKPEPTQPETATKTTTERVEPTTTEKAKTDDPALNDGLLITLKKLVHGYGEGIDVGYGQEGIDDGYGQSGGDYGSAALFSDLNLGSIGDTDFVLPDGILLTSGNANLPLTNTESGFSGQASGQGEESLDALLGAFNENDITRDATALSFDFTVSEGINAISLDFIFGTEEYSEYIDSYPEIAAIFVDGVNYAGFADGSILTLTAATVGNGNFFNNDPWNNGPIAEPLDIEYDGVSAPLTLHGLLDTSLDVHTIKIAVSDTNDGILDTGLFVANLQGLTLGGDDGSGTAVTDPLLPTTQEVGEFEFVVDVGDTGFGIDPSQPIFI